MTRRFSAILFTIGIVVSGTGFAKCPAARGRTVLETLGGYFRTNDATVTIKGENFKVSVIHPSGKDALYYMNFIKRKDESDVSLQDGPDGTCIVKIKGVPVDPERSDDQSLKPEEGPKHVQLTVNEEPGKGHSGITYNKTAVEAVKDALQEAKNKGVSIEFWSDIDDTFVLHDSDAIKDNYPQFKDKSLEQFREENGHSKKERIELLRNGYEDILKELDKNGVQLHFISTRGRDGVGTFCKQLDDVFKTNEYAAKSPSLNDMRDLCADPLSDSKGLVGRTFIPTDWDVYKKIAKEHDIRMGEKYVNNERKGLILSHLVQDARKNGTDKGVLFFIDNTYEKTLGLNDMVKMFPKVFRNWTVYSVFFPEFDFPRGQQ